jgi:DNA-binding beta-propeller fold protein YncE
MATRGQERGRIVIRRRKLAVLGATALAALAAVAAVLAATRGSSGGTLPLRRVADVDLPGPANRFDYQSLDPTTNRLWIAHMNAGQLLAFDVRTRRVVRTVDAPGVHGVIAVPAVHRVYATATDDHELLTLDSRTGRVLRHAPAGDYPDGLAYDSVERRVFVSDESGGIEAVFDADGRRVGTVELGGEAGNVQYDRGSGRILVDVQTRDDVAVVDPRSRRVVRRIALPGCDGPHGLLVDSPRRLAFVACAGNAKLVTLDLQRLRPVATDGIGDDADVLAFDTTLRRLYVAAESGEVAVFAERGRRLRKLGQATLADGAHSVAVDPRTHLVYFPLEDGPELRIMAPTRLSR